MRVLFAPYNVSSMAGITVDELRKRGIEAYSLNLLHSPMTENSRFTKVIPLNKPSASIGNFLRFVFLFPYFLVYLTYHIIRADILHWTMELPFPRFYWRFLIKMFRKKGFVEFAGSDIRRPQTLIKINPYYKKYMFENEKYDYRESEQRSYITQKDFSEVKFTALCFPELFLFLNPAFNLNPKRVMIRMDVNKYMPVYPEPIRKKVVIVHSPSALIIKGSAFVEKAIHELIQEGFDIEYIRNHNIPRKDALNNVSKGDIFIDQLILGSHGSAAIESMSFGKPTVVYLMKELFENGQPAETPLINANPDTIKVKLKELIEDPQLRHQIGKESRAFIEKHHDVEKWADELIKMYEEKLTEK